jgi:hypothetical protein
MPECDSICPVADYHTRAVIFQSKVALPGGFCFIRSGSSKAKAPEIVAAQWLPSILGAQFGA